MNDVITTISLTIIYAVFLTITVDARRGTKYIHKLTEKQNYIVTQIYLTDS